VAPADVRFGAALQAGWIPEIEAEGRLAGTVEVTMAGGMEGLAAGEPGLADRSMIDVCLRLVHDPAGAETAQGAAAAALRDLAERLFSRGRLAAVLVEFPPSFHYSPAARRHLDRLLKSLQGLPLAVAFFNAGWYSVRVIEELKSRGVALCLLDLPQGKDVPPAIDVVTAPLVYLRICGSLCLPAGLSALMSRIEALASQADRLRVILAGEGAEQRLNDARALAGAWRGMR
jgi:uncharacterized protein YecE (DUF72 family)